MLRPDRRELHATRRHVLVVDDQEDNRLLLQHYLEAAGHPTRVASSGEEALRLVAGEPPALVLLDVVMPGLDGFHICTELKAHPDTALIPVVLVTALDGRSDRIAGIEAGADEFLSKPVNREELLARVRSLLRLQATREQLERARLDAEAVKRQRLRGTFERYMSPKLVDEILREPERTGDLLTDRRQRVNATILFADLRGFTRLSEQCRPETVVTLLNEYFTELTRVAFRYDGTIFNMAGDSLLVGFGVPLAQSDAVIRALCTARAMQEEFVRLRGSWQRRHAVQASLGIGINSGDVIAGNVGSPTYMSYTVIGDTVNTASRITALARAGEVKVSAGVRAAARERCPELEFRPESEIPLLKGKSACQMVYRLALPEDPEPLHRALSDGNVSPLRRRRGAS
ncbi:MAG TPA: adenylate/guanylate cyclase domain-containing protein [Gammaproteobacteria bacterium]|nr:adenylate/guanylate cyclase domain-containing protein [Gammaproteobacteria bacterium]